MDFQQGFKYLMAGSLYVVFGICANNYISKQREFDRLCKEPITDVSQLPKIQNKNRQRIYLVRGRIPGQQVHQHPQVKAYSNHLAFCYPSSKLIILDIMRKFDRQMIPWSLEDVRTKDTVVVKGIGLEYTLRQMFKVSFRPPEDINLGLFSSVLAVSAGILQFVCSLIGGIFHRSKNWLLFRGCQVGLFDVDITLHKGMGLIIKCQIDEAGNILPIVIDQSKKHILQRMVNSLKNQRNFLVLLGTLSVLSLYGLITRRKEQKQVLHQGWELLDLPQPQDQITCIVCLTKNRNIVFENCLHLVVCNECYQTLNDSRCPVCKGQIVNAKNIYAKQPHRTNKQPKFDQSHRTYKQAKFQQID